MSRNYFVFCIICSFGTLLSLGQQQKKRDYRKEMIESGEKQQVLEQFQNGASDFSSFKKAKAWNAKTAATLSLTNAVDLDIANIGGRVRSSLVDSLNGIALVAPSGGGLWKFDPIDGSTFEPIDDLGSFMPITSISQDPNNPQHIIIATGDEIHGMVGFGLFESTDGGDNFSQIASTNPVANSDLEHIRFAKFSPHTANTIYMTTQRKMFRSTNGGITWDEVYSVSNDIRSLDFLKNGGVILAIENEGVMISSNGNSGSFSLATSGIPNDNGGSGGTIDGVVLGVHEANRDIIYAMVTGSVGDEIYKTTNGGSTWIKVTTPSFRISQTWFSITIGVHPTDPDIVIGGSIGWGYTKDGGQTWENGADLEVDFHDVHFHSSNPDVAYVGYDQGIGRVNFGTESLQWSWTGTEWVQILQPDQIELGKQGGFNTSQIYYGDYFPESYGDAYLMGQQDGGSFASVSGGQRRILVGDGGSMFVNKQDPTKAFGCTQRGNLKSSVDANAANANSTYTSVEGFYQNHPNWITQFSGNDADGAQMYIADNTSIQRTTNSGGSFSSIASHALDNVKVACENAVDPIVYAVGNYTTGSWPSDLIRIENAATSPTVTTFSDLMNYWDDGTVDHLTVDPNDRNVVYMTASRGSAYRVSGTNNASPTITSIKGDIPDVVFNTVIGIKGEADLLFAGTNIGLFFSEDGGDTWVLSDAIPYTQVTDLRFRESDNRLFVFTYGRGAWAVTVNTEVVGVVSLADDLAIEVFPNPTSSVLNVSGDFEGVITLRMFDVKGDQVAAFDQLSNNQLPDLSSGIYMVHVLEDGVLVGAEKIILN